MTPTLETVVERLYGAGYVDKGGSDVWRVLEHFITKQQIKVYYNDYAKPTLIMIRESVEAHNPNGKEDSHD